MKTRPRRPPQPKNLNYVWCEEHDKFGYIGRKEAKKARRVIHPGEQHLDVYECSQHPGTFHMGHMTTMLAERGVGERRGVDHAFKHLEPHHPSAIQPSPLMMPRKVPV